MKKPRSHSFETLEMSYDELSSPLKSAKRNASSTFTKQSFKFMLRVFNSSLIYSSLTLPFFFQVVGIALGVFTIAGFFCLSFIESTLLLDLKFYARQRMKPATLGSIFKMFKIPTYVSNVYRSINIINSNLYLVLLLSIFQQSIQDLILTAMKQTEPSKWWDSQQFIQLCGTLLIVPFFIKWTYPVYMIACTRLIGIVSMLFMSIFAFDYFKNQDLNSNLDGNNIIRPQDSFTECWTAVPCVLLAFAYHQQFFTGQLDEKSGSDIEKKMKWGAFYGSFFLTVFDMVITILAAYGFYYSNIVMGPLRGNMVEMAFAGLEPKNYGAKITFFLLVGVTAQLQVVQYVPTAVVMILNVIDPQLESEECFENLEFEQFPSEQSFKKSKKSDEVKPKQKTKLKNEIRKSLIMHEEGKLVTNYKQALISAIVFYAIAFLIAMCQPPILLISSLMGCLTQNFITFLIPSILYLDSQFSSDASAYKKCFAWFSIIFSISLALVGTSFGLYALYSGKL